MSEATAGRGAPWFDRAIDRLDAIVPKPAAWAFAFRIWLAMMLALYVAFWLQLDSASSAATGVAILAQPKRGQAISKAIYRFLGTVIGGVVAIVFMALFAQDRVTLLVAFSVWIGVCVFVAQYLQDTRAYGAMLSGYTVAIIALAKIDTPQGTFDAAVGRLAAITVGHRHDHLHQRCARLAEHMADAAADAHLRLGATRAFARETFASGDPGPARTAALIRTIAPMRADASAIAGELDDGPLPRRGRPQRHRRALRHGGGEPRRRERRHGCLRHPSPAVDGGAGGCAAGRLGRRGHARRGRSRPRTTRACAISSMRRSATAGAPSTRSWCSSAALDFVNARDLRATTGSGRWRTAIAPLRDVTLPTHRDFPVALRGALRVAIGFAGPRPAFMILSACRRPPSRWSRSPRPAPCPPRPRIPRSSPTASLIGMPLAATFAGIVLFAFLNGIQGFPLLAIAMVVPGSSSPASCR